MLELINWLKDSKYRLKILELLYTKPYLSSELAENLNINRASISRILKNMKNKGLVDYISNGSRTRTYTITPLGKQALEYYREVY